MYEVEQSEDEFEERTDIDLAVVCSYKYWYRIR